MKREALIYSSGSIVLQAITFLLLPLYANQFSIEDYGKLAFIQVIGMMLSWFLGLQITSAVVRYYNEYELNSRKKLLKSAYAFSFLFNFFLGALLLLILSIFKYPDQTTAYLYLAMFVSHFILYFSNLNSAILRAERKAGKFVFLQIIQALIVLTTTIYFVMILKKGVISVFYGKIAGSFIACLIYYIIWKNWKYLSLFFDIIIVKKLLKFSIYLIPSSLTFWIINASDQLFIKFILGEEQLGIYAYSYKFALLISLLLVTPLTIAWAPYAFHNIKNTSLVKQKLSQMITMFLALGFFILLIMSFYIEDFMRLFAKPEYLKGTKIIFSIGFSYLAFGVSAFTGTAFHIINKTKLLPRITAFSAVINIILNLILINLWGIIGAVVATFLAYILKTLLNIRYLQKDYYIKYNFGIWFKLSFLAIVTYSLGGIFAYYIPNQLTGILIKFVFIIMFSYGSWKILVIDSDMKKFFDNISETIFYKFFNMGYIFKYDNSEILPVQNIAENFEIRIVSKGDADLLKKYSTHHNPNHYLDNILPRLNDPEGFVGIACIDLNNNEVVYLGWIGLKGEIRTFRYYNYIIPANTAFLFDDFTLPKYRRKGIHKRIMIERINYCLDQGYPVIKIAIVGSNIKAMNNIKKFDFIKEERILILKKTKQIWKKSYHE